MKMYLIEEARKLLKEGKITEISWPNPERPLNSVAHLYVTQNSTGCFPQIPKVDHYANRPAHLSPDVWIDAITAGVPPESQVETRGGSSVLESPDLDWQGRIVRETVAS